jgi:hypothetical protein
MLDRGPVLAMLEAASDEEAIALAATPAAAVSVWTGDRAYGERVARGLPAEVAWVDDHGHAAPAATVRVARHVVVRQLASRPVRLPATADCPTTRSSCGRRPPQPG